MSLLQTASAKGKVDVVRLLLKYNAGMTERVSVCACVCVCVCVCVCALVYSESTES